MHPNCSCLADRVWGAFTALFLQIVFACLSSVCENSPNQTSQLMHSLPNSVISSNAEIALVRANQQIHLYYYIFAKFLSRRYICVSRTRLFLAPSTFDAHHSMSVEHIWIFARCLYLEKRSLVLFFAKFRAYFKSIHALLVFFRC